MLKAIDDKLFTIKKATFVNPDIISGRVTIPVHIDPINNAVRLEVYKNNKLKTVLESDIGIIKSHLYRHYTFDINTIATTIKTNESS